jgi:primosomal protein N' (replication factor Y)
VNDPSNCRYAQVILDIPTRSLDTPFDYLIPEHLAAQTAVGCSVLVDFANRPALGYVASISEQPSSELDTSKIKTLRDVLSTPFFTAKQLELAKWISREYLSPLSETIKLLTPPGSAARLKKDAAGNWGLTSSQVGPVDDRWVRLSAAGQAYTPRSNAAKQRAILSALQAGELRVSELGLAVSNASTSLKTLEKQGVVVIESRRRLRGQTPKLPVSPDIVDLTAGQREALEAIKRALAGLSKVTGGAGSADGEVAGDAGRTNDVGSASDTGSSSGGLAGDSSGTTGSGSGLAGDTGYAAQPILLDGITGSGKTEVYLQAIRQVLGEGGTAIVLVPEISLTPQTVARFRARFGELVAVLHSRLSAGERFDQWDLLRSGTARVAVGARSALFAPVENLRLIIIDEEHEGSYKQGSSPRYTSRDVANQLACINNALLVLGSATPSLEALAAVERGQMQLLTLPERPNGRPLPPITVVDLTREFQSGNKTMFSTPLREALLQTIEQGQKAVLLLNRRGYATFLLCRDCGYVPMCEDCSTSLTFHERPPRLICHHCGAEHPVPAVCPDCKSPYLRQLGPGTQYAYDQLQALLPAGTPIVRMDADSTRGRYGHEKCLDEFMAAERGVLLGTQMIAKGLDFPEVTLVGVLIADTALKLPDFRAAERTYQLLEQVAGRAGRAEKDGQVIVQTYWPEHLAIQAAAQHDRELLFSEERELRQEFAYPPYARLANILVWGRELKAVTELASELALHLRADLPDTYKLLGPSPCVISRRQGQHRWHLLVKAPIGSDLPAWLNGCLSSVKAVPGVSRSVDIDPYDLM